MSRASFLDRDGVINRKAPEGQYVTRWEEMHFLPDAATAIALLNRAGFRVIVVSNQRCVAKGLVTAVEVESLHQRMCDALARAGAGIDAVYYCPHRPDEGCSCRKPKTLLFQKASVDFHLDLKKCVFIGDKQTDEDAARRIGCGFIRVKTNTSEIISKEPVSTT